MQAFALIKLGKKDEANQVADFLSHRELEAELREALEELQRVLSE